MGGKKRALGHKKSSGRPPPAVTEEPAGGVPYLPMELWTAILTRTPADDLLRFKRVCKAWHELIVSRSFAESHVDHWTSRPISRILFNVHSPVKGGIFYSSNVNHRGSYTKDDYYCCRSHNLLTSRQRAEMACGSKEKSTVLASCDGLVLICYAERTHYRLLICNPVTGSYNKLPAFQPTGTDQVFIGIPHNLFLYGWTMLRTGSGQYKVCGIQKWAAAGKGRERVCYILELQVGTREQPQRRWKELMVPLSVEWSIQATTTKDGRLHWLATGLPGRDDKYYTIKVLSLDILKEDFSASVSVEPRLCEPEYRFFPWKGAFYHKERREDNSCSLWVLENFDTMTWTEYGNFRLIHDPDFRYFSTVIGDNRLLLGSYEHIYVFDLTSKEFWMLRIDSRGSLGRINVLHTDSLIGCN